MACARIALTLTVTLVLAACTHAPPRAAAAASASADPLAAERARAASDARHQPTLRGREASFPCGARVGPAGARLSAGAHGVGLGLVGLGREGAIVQLGPGAPAELAGPEVRVRRAPGVTEWWRSLAAGLEHGVTLLERLPGNAPLVLEVAVRGARAALADDGGVLFTGQHGATLGRYEGLVVLDARGARAPARLAVTGNRIRIEVDDRDARYPLVVDPIFVTAEGTLLPAALTDDDDFGVSVSMSDDGSRVLVGAQLDDTTGGTNAGSAYVFERDTSGAWSEVATLRAAAAAPNDIFGGAVALSGDGMRALVGAIGDDRGALSNAGSARVYTRSASGTWTEEASLVAPDAANDDWLGRAVALSVDGTRALVGASEHEDGIASDTGAAYVFSRAAGGTWSLEATLRSSFADDYDRFGTAVALSRDGARALLGAPSDDTPVGVRSGSAVVFTRSAGGAWSEEARLVDPSGADDDGLGISVALSADGTTALVGANADSTLNGFAVGSAHVFVRGGAGAWAHDAGLFAALGAEYDILGWSVALSADASLALVGMPGDDFGSSRVDVGSAVLFARRGPGAWVEDSTIVTSDGERDDSFGGAVALSADGARAVIGAHRDTTPRGASTGSARTFALAAPLADGDACAAPAQCSSGFCVDGVCCESACAGGASDCRACAGALTGAPSGTCAPRTVGAVCRAASAPCDAAEACDGTSVACPPDALASAGTECRAARSACDVAEACSGTSATCPGDVVVGAGVVCRPATAGGCDRAEVCDGIDGICPGDGFAAAGVVCRAALGACDVAEVCGGIGPDCPTDAFTAAGSPCRDAAGPCDVAESCPGDAAACPVDAFAPASVVCDATVAGVCDAPDHCSGSAAACPDDYLSGVECRPAGGSCDLAEVCAGASAACPPDGLVAASVVCRASIDPSCDPAESCDGASVACPSDVVRCAPSPDAGLVDGGLASDAGVAGSPPAVTGCGCRVGGRAGAWPGLALGASLVLAVFSRRRAVRSDLPRA